MGSKRLKRKSDEVVLSGRLSGFQRFALSRLLDMMYIPSELAEEIGFSVRQVYRVYVPLGCPHTKDKNGRLWINGKEFREWVSEVYKKCEVGKDEVFCLTCKKSVPMVSPVKRIEGQISFYVCECPNCKRRIARIVENRGRKK